MKSDKFYEPPVTKAYAQSMVFLHYLVKQHPAEMKGLIDKINKGEVQDNNGLLTELQAALKMDFKTLEMRYIDFGLRAMR
jgi:hypothetical protein